MYAREQTHGSAQRLRHGNGMKYPIWYTEKGMTGGIIGWQKFCIIAVKPDYKGDVGLYHHELTHVKQWALMSLVTGLLLAAVWLPLTPLSIAIHSLLYTLVPAYKLRCEVAAFKEQLRHYPDDRALKFAGFISRNYGLNITQEQAVSKLVGD